MKLNESCHKSKKFKSEPGLNELLRRNIHVRNGLFWKQYRSIIPQTKSALGPGSGVFLSHIG